MLVWEYENFIGEQIMNEIKNEVLRIEGLKYYYPESEKAVLDGISLSLQEGEFALLFGNTGSGKSTLLKCISGLIPKYYGGRFAGIIYKKKPPSLLFQDPENQIVMNKVSREISYPLEDAEIKKEEIEKRLMQSVNVLSIGHLLNRETLTLSSGEKQKVALASILCSGCTLLLMDEPTSMLDPESESDFLHTLEVLKKKGYTILVSTHEPETYAKIADRYFRIENGKLYETKLYKPNKDETRCKVKMKYKMKSKMESLKRKDGNKACKCLLELQSVYFSYGDAYVETYGEYGEKEEKEVLKGVNFKLYEGEIVAILGKNGAGKTTLLRHFNGLKKPKKGKVIVDGLEATGQTVAKLSRKVGYLSQNPSDYLFADTVEEEIEFSLKCAEVPKHDWSRRKNELSRDFSLTEILNKYPRDLSAGERERVAFAALLACEPKILALDEPTRGLDNQNKNKLMDILIKQKEKGRGIVFATHDLKFARSIADRFLKLDNGMLEEILEDMFEETLGKVSDRFTCEFEDRRESLRNLE